MSSVSSLLQLILFSAAHRKTNLDSEATGWKKGATESELGDLRTSHSVEADEVNREKTEEWKGKKKIRLLPLFFFFFLHKDGDTGRLSAASSLSNLHVVGREKAVGASAHASPPTLVDHLDVGDDVIGVEGYLVVAG